MLIKARFRFSEVFFGMLLAVSIFAIGLVVSPSIFPPNQSTENSASTEKSSEKPKKFGESESTEDRIAKYTLWLAILTGGLVIVSGFQGYFLIRSDRTARITAEAAQRSAESLTIVERASVYPVIITPGAIEACLRAALSSNKDDIPESELAELTFRLKNFGKTPAILKEAFVAFGAAPHGALIGVSIPESVLASLEETSPIPCPMQIGITRKQAQHILAYTGHISFEGHVTFDDMWGKEHTIEFYFVWDQQIRWMALRGVETKTSVS
jgi:hypothetical protein